MLRIVQRLRFVKDGLNGWYRHAGTAGYPPREAIDAVKGHLWTAIGTLRDSMSGRGFGEELKAQYNACFAVDAMTEFMKRERGFDAKAYLDDERRAHLGALEAALSAFLQEKLAGFTAGLYTRLAELTQDWPKERRWDLLVRYLGFPFWDVLLYPIQALTDVGERDHVEIVRISPRDAHRIPVPPDQPRKLKGAESHHFGAFLSRSGRERDYLWGRLDGAERLIGILVDGATEPDDPAREEAKARWCKEAFLAILEEDAQAVPRAAELIAHVRATVGSG